MWNVNNDSRNDKIVDTVLMWCWCVQIVATMHGASNITLSVCSELNENFVLKCLLDSLCEPHIDTMKLRFRICVDRWTSVTG